ncbi:Sedoheptulose 1-7-bisphosphatase [Apiospora arundinis]
MLPWIALEWTDVQAWLSVAWHAVEQAAVKPVDDVLVMGAGPIGLVVIMVVELSTTRKEFARQCRATTVIDPQEEDIVAKCRNLCDGQGLAVVLECAGVTAIMDAVCKAVRTKGLIVNVALWDEPVPIDMMTILLGEKRTTAVIDALESG